MTDEEMAQALADVRDELIRRGSSPLTQAPVMANNQFSVTPASPVDWAKASELATYGRLVLSEVLHTLDGWIEGAKSNHQGMGHRGENRGEECWRSFTPMDIRLMVNDAAREMSLSEFGYEGTQEEDQPLEGESA
jgi:hypothetical protein